MSVGAAVSFLGAAILLPAVLVSVMISARSFYLLFVGPTMSGSGITIADVVIPLRLAVILVIGIVFGAALMRLGRHLGER